jgi:hypothetical protein
MHNLNRPFKISQIKKIANYKNKTQTLHNYKNKTPIYLDHTLHRAINPHYLPKSSIRNGKLQPALRFPLQLRELRTEEIDKPFRNPFFELEAVSHEESEKMVEEANSRENGSYKDAGNNRETGNNRQFRENLEFR